MENELAKIKKFSEDGIKNAGSPEELEKLRVEILGRKGALTLILRSLKDLPENKRKKIGSEANALYRELENKISQKEKELQKSLHETVLQKERLDITRPGAKRLGGHLHPLTKIRRELEEIFNSMGFGVVEGPEIELEYYNFDSLNMPELHPAREMQDTWWLKYPPVTLKRGKKEIKSHLLLRTQVTSIQVRYMERRQPPFRIIMPGFVFRREATDASHETQFLQMDGLMVDDKVSLADLKGIMEAVMRRIFGKNIKTRIRASYFPFTEPSIEMDIGCLVCRQKGCPVCKQSGWIEVFPGGMVHPHVFKEAGYVPGSWHGIAFDLALDRLAMMKYKIPDIRLLYSGDLRFLNQF